MACDEDQAVAPEMLGAGFRLPAQDHHADHAYVLAACNVHLEVKRADGRVSGRLAEGGRAGEGAEEDGAVQRGH